jgi:hypothetical protein
LKHLISKKILPTDLSSAEVRQIDASLRRQSLFSARTTLTDYLEDIKASVESLVNPKTNTREDRKTAANPEGKVTEGLNPATARETLRDSLKSRGYLAGEDLGTIKDLASDARLNLIIKTNTELAQGAGHFAQQNLNDDVVDLYPALELVRFEDRKQPRDWETRWNLAAQVANDPAAAGVLERSGRMVALKSSGIWDALGDGAGGYMDTLGNPYPPFAFNSGMWTQDVSRADAEELGLLDQGEEAKPAAFDLGSLFSIST